MAETNFKRRTYPVDKVGQAKTHAWKVSIYNKVNDLQYTLGQDLLSEEERKAVLKEIKTLIYTYAPNSHYIIYI